jgi:hypothetical protein
MRSLAEIEADLARLEFLRMNPCNVSGERYGRIAGRLAGDVPDLLGHIEVQAAAQQAYRDHVRGKQVTA